MDTTTVAPVNARHSMDSPEWYTPSVFVDAARDVMGSIDLDPASHAEANARIKADTYYTAEDNGLLRPWHGRVFLNPPGGSDANGSLVAQFWKKLMAEYHAGHVTQAIWIGYSLEQLQTLQQTGEKFTPLHYPTCFTRKRIAFVENESKRTQRLSKLSAQGKKPNMGSSPSHSNYITYLGGRVPDFQLTFGERFGQVVVSEENWK